MTAFTFELVTPERVLWTGEAEAVSMRTDVGEATFLANHASLVGALDITALRITPSLGGEEGAAGAEESAAVHGGFVHVDQNKVVVAAPVAELAGEIDVERARRALQAAQEAATAEPPAAGDMPRGAYLDPSSAEARARRARIRLEVAGADPNLV
jgi:F-type H+-transporting ATPase subunit epsilon